MLAEYGNARKMRTMILVLISGCLLCTSLVGQQVLTGIDVLQQTNFAALQDKRIGLITNHTGIDRNWRTTIDILHRAPQVNLVALFTPEHGIRGDTTGAIASYRDRRTSLPVYSLYGETRRPTAAMLSGLDVLIFDIQDIGTRFYTYIGTMKNCMEEAAKHGLAFIVLDRPNPLNGIAVQGPVLAAEHTFELAGIYELPIRHGMTTGELARLFSGEDQMNLELTVIPLQGWDRRMWFDETRLPWINPSPNIRSFTQAALYPGIGLLERINVNNKRGLDRPFEMFGAPWINGRALADELHKYHCKGIGFIPIRFNSSKGIYKDQLCEGVSIELCDRDTYQPVESGLAIIQALYQLYPDQLDIDKLWHLLRSEAIINAIKSGQDFKTIPAIWQEDLDSFKQIRKQYLLY